jgi:hypothetical protein
MLTHVMRGNSKSVLVIDEPDIYLHPELQRKLLRIVRERFGQFVMATHSVEIINEAEPGAVISVHPDAKSAKRVLTDEEYQALFNYLGSFENIDFSRLGRARRIVFFEGKDKKLLRRFAQKLGAIHFANDLDTIVLQAGGFGQWRRVKDVAWTFGEVLKLEVSIFALFDRDYRSDEEIERFLSQMQEDNFKCFVLKRKEIENYALARNNLIRVITMRQEQRIPQSRWLSGKQISRLINAVSGRLRSETYSQIVGHRIKYFQQIRSGIDSSAVTKEATIKFEKDWADIDRRLSIIGGKEFIAQLSATLQKTKGFSITVNMLIDGLLRDEVSQDLMSIIRTLDDFCRKD